MARALATAALVLWAIPLGGCDTQDADATIGALDFYGALLDGQGAAACSRLTPGARAAVSAASHASCPVGILELSPSKAFLGGLKINDALVAGHQAVVAVIPFNTNAAAALRAHLAYASGVWRMEEPLPGLASRPGGSSKP
jgi:hypothetical protein